MAPFEHARPQAPRISFPVLCKLRARVPKDRIPPLVTHCHTCLSVAHRLPYAGLPVDCRNILNIPRERLKDFRQSPTLDLVSTTSKLFAVSESSISSYAYAPVWRPGGECCRQGASKEGYVRGFWLKTNCCQHRCVQSWLEARDVGANAMFPHRAWADGRGTLRSLFRGIETGTATVLVEPTTNGTRPARAPLRLDGESDDAR